MFEKIVGRKIIDYFFVFAKVTIGKGKERVIEVEKEKRNGGVIFI